MLNPLTIARVGDLDAAGYRAVEADPADLYPQTIAHIRQRLAANSAPDGALKQEWDAALQIPQAAWEVALLPKGQVNESAHALRAAALEIARRWFTEVLHQAVGGPVALRITRDLTYKL